MSTASRSVPATRGPPPGPSMQWSRTVRRKDQELRTFVIDNSLSRRISIFPRPWLSPLLSNKCPRVFQQFICSNPNYLFVRFMFRLENWILFWVFMFPVCLTCLLSSWMCTCLGFFSHLLFVYFSLFMFRLCVYIYQKGTALQVLIPHPLLIRDLHT